MIGRALFLLFAALVLVSCKREKPVGAAPPRPRLAKADSLWLANDYAELGWDRYSYEEYDSGLVYFDSALRFDSTHSQAWHGRALMLDNLNREADAEDAYRQAERFDSTNRQAIWHLGCHYARAGEKEKALRQLRTVISLDSTYAIGVRTEDCWITLWDDPDFLRTVGAVKRPSN